jgi:hypothetical protein
MLFSSKPRFFCAQVTNIMTVPDPPKAEREAEEAGMR